MGIPEGKKRWELAGRQKQDKEYLLLYKLSTFLNPDLRKQTGNYKTHRRLIVKVDYK
jgi:hypothetical protein